MPQPATEPARGTSPIHAIAAALALSIGFDLLLHGGLLARLYVQPSPFLLAAEDAFRRIPLGYLTFFVLTVSLYWLLHRLGVRSAARGFRYGLVAGAVVWGALVLGLYSISTAPASLLAGWWVGQTSELALAGALLGAAARGLPAKRMWGIVAVVVLLCVVITIALQSVGLAPPMRLT